LIEKSVHLLKNARGHLFLFQNNFSAFKYFYRASSEKKSPRASSEKKSLQAFLEEKSPWPSLSMPKYYFSIQIFLQGIFSKKRACGHLFLLQKNSKNIKRCRSD